MILIVVLSLGLPCCAAHRCNKALVQCRTGCERQYQICQANGNDEYYCHNFIGNCLVQCDHTHASCS